MTAPRSLFEKYKIYFSLFFSCRFCAFLKNLNDWKQLKYVYIFILGKRVQQNSDMLTKKLEFLSDKEGVSLWAKQVNDTF